MSARETLASVVPIPIVLTRLENTNVPVTMGTMQGIQIHPLEMKTNALVCIVESPQIIITYCNITPSKS